MIKKIAPPTIIAWYAITPGMLLSYLIWMSAWTLDLHRFFSKCLFPFVSRLGCFLLLLFCLQYILYSFFSFFFLFLKFLFIFNSYLVNHSMQSLHLFLMLLIPLISIIHSLCFKLLFHITHLIPQRLHHVLFLLELRSCVFYFFVQSFELFTTSGFLLLWSFVAVAHVVL